MERVRRATAAIALVLATGCGGSSHADAKVFCQRLERLSENDPFRAFGARATTTEIETAFDALQTSASGLAAVAPDDARSAARAYADSVDRMRSLLQGAAFDGSQVDQRAYRDAQVDYFAASTRLERYLTSSCR